MRSGGGTRELSHAEHAVARRIAVQAMQASTRPIEVMRAPSGGVVA